MSPAPDDILAFWFERAGPARWFAVDAAFDAEVRRRYAAALFEFERTGSVEDCAWLDDPDDALALVLGLDQFPRNVWRGTAKAFAFDSDALAAAHIALAKGYDRAVPVERRAFFYMPFMHSESLADQDFCVTLCEERLDPAGSTARHARAHRDLIVRFGRFPHRNAALDRESTPEERAFLEGGGYQPGAKRPAK
ncbi:DUF924 domain-containing protein [Marinicauda salina]|jgi:uncharacterized protein (DUF924 family)|uniref:DUF924 domain-containing protein n=1 Tax=Marinicauda salina TaxID=2135793 RepID=A0A2U2BS72_9PROT|nr:DUF924 family protein [Marinicauda salina]PWE16849.1 DUF924 domain-containing protein [Marinicauda salina]